ncbi:uncharacterized protein LOC134179875 isoform X2 [Corticium candelabrum]|uniref:uncharacterized protein LOC134179875 isoform X2 n=1 Tax=Corticium candelabrum TaxID=121492 RepID=UPI002E27218F|nr:uncharacterized protein LOC134179875 isoform X2 [Corticium candelabrum]
MTFHGVVLLFVLPALQARDTRRLHTTKCRPATHVVFPNATASTPKGLVGSLLSNSTRNASYLKDLRSTDQTQFLSTTPGCVVNPGSKNSIFESNLAIGVYSAAGGALVVIMIIGSIWLVRKYRREGQRKNSSNPESERLLDTLQHGGANGMSMSADALSGVEAAICSQQKDLKCAADDHDITMPYMIETCTANGRIVLDRLGRFAVFLPVQPNITATTISVSHLPLGYTSILPNEVIPLSPPIRLLPAGFEYERPALLIMAINVCISRDVEIRLWHNTNFEDPHFTELDDTECHIIDSTTSGSHRYVACWLKHHCDVVPCYIVRHKYWQLYAGVFAEAAADYESLRLPQLFLIGEGTADGMMLLDLERGFNRLAVSLMPLEQDQILASVCQCKTGTQFVQHIVFCGSLSSSCTLSICTLTGGVCRPPDQPFSPFYTCQLVCQKTLNLNEVYDCGALSLAKQQQQQGASLTTWCLPLENRQRAPVCFQTRAQELRNQGTTLNNSNLSRIADYFMKVGTSVSLLLTLAQRLHSSLEGEVRKHLNLEADTSEVATICQLEKLLSCYICTSSEACVEEVLALFKGLQDQCRVGYCEDPPCDDDAVCQFEKLIALILSHKYDTNLYEPFNPNLEFVAIGASVHPQFNVIHSHDLCQYCTTEFDQVAPRAEMLCFDSTAEITIVSRSTLHGQMLHNYPGQAVPVNSRQRDSSFDLNSSPRPLSQVTLAISPATSYPVERTDALVKKIVEMNMEIGATSDSTREAGVNDLCSSGKQDQLDSSADIRHEFYDTSEKSTRDDRIS